MEKPVVVDPMDEVFQKARAVEKEYGERIAGESTALNRLKLRIEMRRKIAEIYRMRTRYAKW
jgi:hypothetical protein